MKSISLALQGAEPEKVQDALRVLDIVLRQQAANRYNLNFCILVILTKLLFSKIMDVGCRGCLLVRQSFFHDDSRFFTDVGGGVTGCRGFHSSFRPTHGGLSLNMGITYYCP